MAAENSPENLRYDLDKLREDMERIAKDVQELNATRQALKDVSLSISAMYDLIVQRNAGNIFTGARAILILKKDKCCVCSRRLLAG